MIQLSLSLAFVAYCSCLGAAWIFLLRPAAPRLRSWLVSPAVGLALVVLCVMVLNQAGLPISRFARLLAVVLLVAAVIALRWRGARLPFRALLPVMACQLLTLGLTGWPALSAGLHWAGYGNVDMLGYVFAAQRQMAGGFYEAPTLSALQGLDYTQYYWFYHVPGFVRFGSENTVAFVASVAGLKPLESFIPAILALGLMQISGLAALVLHLGRHRRWAYLAAFIFSLSPLFQLSLDLQVIAQVGGIALLLAVCSLAAERLRGPRFSLAGTLQRALLLAPVFAGFMVFYPELLPFCGAVLLLAHLLADLGWRHLVRILAVATATVLAGAILLRQNLLSGVMTLLFHGGQGTTSAAADVFAHPFGMAILPSALPALLGWSNLFTPPPEPWLSLLIATAMVALLALGLFCLCRRLLREPAVILFLVMAALGLVLHLAPSPFGVFKLSMFIQPALAAVLAAAALRLHRLLRWPLLLAVLFTGYQVGQQYLLVCSGRAGFGSFLPYRAAEPIVIPPVAPGAIIEADTPSMAFDHLLGLQLRGQPLHFKNRDSISGAMIWALNNDPRNLWPQLERLLPDAIGRTDPYKEQLYAGTYHTLNVFGAEMIELGQGGKDSLLLSVRPPFGHFNNLHAPTGSLIDHPVFTLHPAASLRNHLIFLNTSRSNDYYSYLGSLRRAYSYYQFEPDPMRRHDRPFYAIGRYFIFEVKNPDEQIRLRLSFSRTLLGAGRQSLPGSVQVTGRETVNLPLAGAGAVNVYTAPLAPMRIKGRYFVAVDLNCEAAILHKPKSPLMALFHSTTAPDWRLVAGYGRDISALSDGEYRRMQPPGKIEVFPEDLFENPALEFSGLYEDGWVSPSARVGLHAPAQGAALHLIGEVPLLPVAGGGPVPELSVLVNGTEIARFPLTPGRFEKTLTGPVAGGRNTIELKTTGHFILPSPDDRPASFRLVQMRLD